MQTFKNQIKTFLNFNKRQERGAFVLIVLIVVAFSINLLLPKIIKEKDYDFSSSMAEINEWKKNAIEIKTQESNTTENDKYKNKNAELIRLNPVPFNPNKLPEQKWLEMGMPKLLVNNILKYESKGGRFKKKEDLQKIYGLTPIIYEQLADFIRIPDAEITEEKETTSSYTSPAKSRPNILLDINRTDSVELLQVPGIGPFYAGQIVRYRKRLGGYNSIEQLSELYKMDSLRLKSFLPYLTIKDTILGRIDVNAADFKTLLSHPYVDYETTKKIFNLKRKLGRFAGMYQLRNDSILNDSLFKKLEPYLKVD